jgi:arabinose-5-phosphate isomerase
MAATSKPAKIAPVNYDIEVGRRVLAVESAGLTALAGVLDGSYVDALDLMSAARGRVVVSGMGKSGHIACKIAATLASTGTPAQYVNAADASHGDLGMITPADVVLALSNSGETAELSDLVAYTKLHRIPLIAVTGRIGSSLDKAADVSLMLPEMPEACSMNLTPTTSTTMMLALGDALAVSLLERRGFSPDDFNSLHPGGQLGNRFLKLDDVMHAGDEVPLVEADTVMSQVLITMTTKRFGCVGVVDDKGHLIGIVTDGDLRRHMDEKLLVQKARDVMSKEPRTLPPDRLAASALRMMNERSITSIFVVEDATPIGIVHIHDLLRAGIV